MLDATVRRIVTSPLEPLADTLVRFGVAANALTIGGFAMGLIAAAFIANEAFLPGVIFLALNRTTDILDGMVARRTRTSSVGMFLDTSLDLFVYAAIPFAFALAHQQDALAATFMLMALMVAAVPEMTVQAFLRNGAKQRVHALCGHSETFVAFILLCIAPRWMFSLLAYLFGVLYFVSAGVTIASAIAYCRTIEEP
jgi:phosphatidylglycerophosphate synthase